MTDGAALLAAMTWSFWGNRLWRDERGANLLDGGAPFYDCFETAEGHYISIAPLEQNFFDLFLHLTGLESNPATQGRMNPHHWPALRAQFSALFRSKSRDEWCALLEQTDVCFAPVLSLADAPLHSHNAARGTFAEVGGMLQPMPAPRYTTTPTAPPRPAPAPGADTDALLEALGYDAVRIAALRQAGIFGAR
jgi:alpha-methylacyl-CoA racemase